MSISIFKISDDGNLIVNDIELLAVDSFRSIIKRDRTLSVDAQKVLAFKELAYIWFIADSKSPVNRKGFDTKEANNFAKEKVGLPKEWKADELVKKAIVDYTELSSSIGQDIIQELLYSFRNYGKVIRKVRAALDAILDNPNSLNKSQAEEVIDLISTLLSISKSIPKEVQNLKEALIELEKDTDNTGEQLRGTTESVPNSALPGKDW